MKFTYKAYENLLLKVREKGYDYADYEDWMHYDRCVIMRHDIDFDLHQAVKLAEIEQYQGVAATYFVMLTSDFYNIFSKKSMEAIHKIHGYGHKIGLHFDEARYQETVMEASTLEEKIVQEAKILSEAAGCKVNVVSMHRPSQNTLQAGYEIPGLINSYGQTFLKEFKYLSDSRRRWREPVDQILDIAEYDRLHILTHAFWYHEKEKNMQDSLYEFVKEAGLKRYECLLDNVSDLEEIIDISL